MSQSNCGGWMLRAKTGGADVVRALTACSGLIFVAQRTMRCSKPDQARNKSRVIKPEMLLFQLKRTLKGGSGLVVKATMTIGASNDFDNTRYERMRRSLRLLKLQGALCDNTSFVDQAQ